MFVSPFFAKLRYDYRHIASLNTLGRTFPIYMVIRGRANAGKSAIVTTGQRLMFAQKLNAIPKNQINETALESYKLDLKGVPVFIDDMDNTRKRYFIAAIKNDTSYDKLLQHGAFIVTTNQFEQMILEVTKRTVIFTINNNQIPEEKAAVWTSKITNLQENMGNAFYRKFLKKMLPAVREFSSKLSDKELCKDWFPDIFKIASKKFMEVISETGMKLPKELRCFHWKDYMGEAIKSQNVLNMLVTEFTFNPTIFDINQKADLMKVDFSKYDINTAKNMLKTLQDELPVAAECSIVGYMAIMKWSEVKKFAKTDFSIDEGFMSKLRNFFKQGD